MNAVKLRWRDGSGIQSAITQRRVNFEFEKKGADESK
jgi:hypothetical protein